MTFNDVLLAYLAHLRAENKSITIGWDTIQLWPDGALKSFIKLGLLKPASAAQSIKCNGCEKHCFMDVITLPNNDTALSRAFVICDDSEMQSQMGRINVPLVRLQQWQGSLKQLAKVFAQLLNLADKIELSPDQSIIKLGMLKSANGRKWVTLNCLDLSIEINQQAVPVEDILFFEERELVIDQAHIDVLLTKKSLNTEKKHTPSTNKREARKLATQVLHQDWKDEYLRQRKKYPGKTITWYAARIAKMAIAKDRGVGTIHKIMVK